MKQFLTTLFAALLLCGPASGQAVITSWWRNAAGKTSSYWYRSGSTGPFTLTATSDSADCVKVLYSKDSVWIYSHGMTDRMGAYSNPGACSTQTYVHRFPRVSNAPTTKSVSPKVGQIGLLLNGIPIYGLGDSYSWNGTTNANNGSAVWNREVYIGEGVSLDTAFTAHPQQQGAYHSHAMPKRLYETYSSSVHSPIVGWAFDGYPVYGPYGYSSALNSASAISRMKSGYSLRNITTRTTFPTIPNGGGATSQIGPAVSGTYPLGTYVEDYEWLSSNGGDLDQYNGRFCVTPEFPSGTYAYFVTMTSGGAPQFPYYIGPYYYGTPVTADYPAGGQSSTSVSLPATGSGLYAYTGGTILPVKLIQFSGKTAANGNLLRWTLAKGESLQIMELERSDNGQEFQVIASLLPRAGEPGVIDYSYPDAAPMPQGFYRLRLKEWTGDALYSPIVVLRRSEAKELSLYPSIANTNIELDGISGSGTLEVLSATGDRMLTKAISGEGHCRLDVSSLPSGMYLLRVASDANFQALRFFKQ